MVVIIFDHKKFLNNNGSSNELMSPKSPSLDAKTGNTTPVSMTAIAQLLCQPTSHKFEDRSLSLENPVKVGRSVAKVKPTQNNAIFDCKVLSRNHAVIWFENGQFYLKDTKSSNGTFINNQRLSKGSEESPPMEINSGDIIQFGVDVMENSKKVTHGCIIAAIKLYMPDGNEAKPSQTTSVIPNSVGIPSQDLYTLQSCLQDAIRKEQLLSTKLASLQQIVLSSQEASKSSWKALIDEDRLLSRIEILEVQLQTYSKNFTEDKLREEIQRLTDEKLQYQETAKERLEKLLQEKLEICKKLHDTEMLLDNANSEYSHLLQINKQNQEELMELAMKHTKQVQQVEDLTKSMEDAENQHLEALAKLEQEKQDLETTLQELKLNENLVNAKVQILQSDKDQYKTEEVKHNGELSDIDELNAKNKLITDTKGEITLVDPRVKQLEDEVKSIQEKLELSEKNILKKNAEVELLQGQLGKAQVEEKSFIETEREYIESNGSFSDMTIVSESHNLTHDNEKLDSGEHLQKLLSETRNKKASIEADLENVKKELMVAKEKMLQTEIETSDLRSQLKISQQQMKEKCDYVSKLHSQMTDLEGSAKEVKDQLLNLKNELFSKQKEVDVLKKKIFTLEENKDESNSNEGTKISKVDVDSNNLYTSLTAIGVSDTLANVVGQISEQLSHSKSGSSDSGIVNPEHSVKMMSEECCNLKEKLKTNEATLKRTIAENEKLLKEYNKMQDAFNDLESLHGVLKEAGKEDLFTKLESAHKELLEKSRKLEVAQGELLQVRESFCKVTEERKCLKNELVQIEEQYKLLAYQNQMTSACCAIPLLIVLIALVVAFYPTLATITGTRGS